MSPLPPPSLAGALHPLPAFLPYWVAPSYSLGPFTLQIFGVFVAAGVLLAARQMVRAAQRQGLDPQPLQDFPIWGLLGGLVGAHLVHVLLYHPDELRGFGLLRVWDGLSSTGGVVGGAVAAVAFFRSRRVPFARYADALALGLAPGWALARVGCFAVHDHPGVLTQFPLAVAFPGGARHDLGLYDAVVLAALAALLTALERRGVLRGRLLPLLAVLYSSARIALDFLRATDLPYVDARYLGLTPAQYICAALFVWGAWHLRPKPAAAPARPARAA